jgi:hypothetical protein
MVRPTGTLERVFVAFVKPEEWGDFSVYLVNNTPAHYRRVVTLTGMFASVDEDLLESTRARADRGELLPYSTILLEDGDYRDLDFVIWYHLDLVPADPARQPERLWSQFGGLSFVGRGHPERLPVLDRDGWLIQLRARQGSSDL